MILIIFKSVLYGKTPICNYVDPIHLFLSAVYCSLTPQQALINVSSERTNGLKSFMIKFKKIAVEYQQFIK